MASPLYVAKKGTFDEFREVFNAEEHDATSMLMAALTNRDPEARASICNYTLDKGADAGIKDEDQNTLTVLLGRHRHLGEGDGDLVMRLVDGGADVNFRARLGYLPLRLAVEIRADDDEKRRPVYEALFGAETLDLELPSDKGEQEETLAQWLRRIVDDQPDKFNVLDEFLKAKGY